MREGFLPAALVTGLKDLAARGSPELADRVEYLFSTARKRDARPAGKGH